MGKQGKTSHETKKYYFVLKRTHNPQYKKQVSWKTLKIRHSFKDKHVKYISFDDIRVHKT